MISLMDRNQLPQGMKNFTKMSVCGVDDDTPKTILKTIQDTQKFGWGLQEYDDAKGFGEINNAVYNIVMLFDDNTKPLGYYIIASP